MVCGGCATLLQPVWYTESFCAYLKSGPFFCRWFVAVGAEELWATFHEAPLLSALFRQMWATVKVEDTGALFQDGHNHNRFLPLQDVVPPSTIKTTNAPQTGFSIMGLPVQ